MYNGYTTTTCQRKQISLYGCSCARHHWMPLKAQYIIVQRPWFLYPVQCIIGTELGSDHVLILMDCQGEKTGRKLGYELSLNWKPEAFVQRSSPLASLAPLTTLYPLFYENIAKVPIIAQAKSIDWGGLRWSDTRTRAELSTTLQCI